MARDLGLDDVVDHFTLIGDELDQLRNKSGATRLGFAVLLKFLLWRGRFPRGLHEVPDDAVAHLARQVRVTATELGSFDFASRTAKRHRTEIRAYTGFRECSVADAEALAGWLAQHVASGERRPERVREELILRCRAELIEPPTPERVSEIARSALHQAEQALLALIADRLDAVVVARLEALIAVSDEDENVLGLIKAAPGNVSLETMLVEISKLEAVRAIGLPAGLFDGIDARIIAGWRARAAVESPVHLREHPQPTKLALLCALLYLREREVTDALAQLLISTVHRINARSEEKVITELVKDFKRVTGKETLLRKIAEASLGTPDDTVREVIFPVVGGEATLQDLVAEYRQKGTEYQRQKRKVFNASYSNHYRRGLIRLLGVLEFRSNNTAHQPIIDALALIVRYAHSSAQYYPLGEHVVLKPLDPAAFTAQLRQEMRGQLAALNDALPGLDWLRITNRKSGAIQLTPLGPQLEPRNLRRLKKAIRDRWGQVPLIDMVTEAALRTGMLGELTAVGPREALARAVLWERLLLLAYAYGTNTGISAVAAGEHGHSEADLRYTARRHFTIDGARAVAIQLANATFAARQNHIWGQSTTTVASDSTHFRAYDQNLFTEWHSRYGGRGVLIYWHIEKHSMAVHSQLISCAASEVAAMIEGAVRHGTTMALEGNYVDSHGQTEIGFAIALLLGFDLLPRIKQINKVKLYQPDRGNPDAYPSLTPAMTRPIRWELIEQNYDMLVKYATAIRVGTASTEAILRRFTRNASHPVYQAMLELGRVQKTIFVARYLRDRDLQREIEEGLNLIEAWNRVNGVIFYGKSGEFATNRREQQELGMLSLHILQAALVYVNTLMIQDILAEPEWASVLTPEDLRGLTPLFWAHVLPYGEVKLNMTKRIPLSVAQTDDSDAESS
ncbi:MAG: Tn3 family transposase [Solirubrobacteraceae bacterium]